MFLFECNKGDAHLVDQLWLDPLSQKGYLDCLRSLHHDTKG